jgi:hypothetical protein
VSLHHEVDDVPRCVPTRRMWLAELAVFAVSAATAFLVILALLPIRRPVTLDATASVLLLAASVAVGIVVSGRFRAWGLRRAARR